MEGILSIAKYLGLGKEEALDLYEEERKHERKARCAEPEDSREAEERAARQVTKEKRNQELRNELDAAQNTSGSGSEFAEILVSEEEIKCSSTRSVCHK